MLGIFINEEANASNILRIISLQKSKTCKR